ncbi:arsenate reductase ArsC [Streptomyces sp. NPDC023723]|uniref:arsenate reductase ArsC n=1 Tax=Streptomyces sp. NPDC023723 TaxID=3154323 RepID=UPI00340CFFB1
MSETKPSVLFVCVHNAGRSQLAAAFLTHLGTGRVQVRSAGSAPASTVNPAVVEALAEVGIDISAETPKVLTTEAVQASDVVITMGCGDACPYFPGKRYLDWQLDDPAGQGIAAIRPIRDEIERRIRGLLAELGIEARSETTSSACGPKSGGPPADEVE